MFVPPRNAIGRAGLRAIEQAGLHLGGVAGLRSGWSRRSPKSWAIWARLRAWKRSGGEGLPWVLDLGDHREIAGNAVTPVSRTRINEASFAAAMAVNGAFCLATHYWELSTASVYPGEPAVGEQLRSLVEKATSTPHVEWRSVGDVTCESTGIYL